MEQAAVVVWGYPRTVNWAFLAEGSHSSRRVHNPYLTPRAVVHDQDSMGEWEIQCEGESTGRQMYLPDWQSEGEYSAHCLSLKTVVMVTMHWELRSIYHRIEELDRS